MRLFHQLVLFMLVATVVPVAGVGFWTLSQSEQALAERLVREQTATARSAADAVSAELMHVVHGLARAADVVDWAQASEEEARGALSLLYQQSSWVSAVALRWPHAAARPDLGPIFLPEGRSEHPGFEPATGMQAWRAALSLQPLEAGERGQVAMSAPYVVPGGRRTAVAVAVKVDEGPQAPFAVAEVGLDALSELLRGRAAAGTALHLLDAESRLVATSAGAEALGRPHALLAEARLTPGEVARLGPPGGRVWAVPVAVPGELGLRAVAVAEEAVVLGPVRALRKTVLGASAGSAVLLLAMGFLFTRRLGRRIRALGEGAEAYAQGDLTRRVALGGADELSELAGTFNRMGTELEAARARMGRWNDELRQRVDEATAELRTAQAKLLEAQKLAAIGQLGAGVAHEINNPLCGILGNAQLLMLEHAEGDPDFEMLRKIELSAKRCKEITQNLLRFSESQESHPFRPLDLNALVREALFEAPQDGIQRVLDLHPHPLTVWGDPGALVEAVRALVSNACTAMRQSPERTLTVRTRPSGEDVALSVGDTGKGIAPEHLPRLFEPFFTTKEVWSNVGLGLSVAYRTVTQHRGRIDVQTHVGRGSTFTVTFPASAPQAEAVAEPSARPRVGGEGVGILG